MRFRLLIFGINEQFSQELLARTGRVCVCVSICIYIYIYVHKYIYIYICIYIDKGQKRFVKQKIHRSTVVCKPFIKMTP